MVLVMSVEPGFGGQEFLDVVLPKMRRVRRAVDDAGARGPGAGRRWRVRGHHRPLRRGRGGRVRGRLGGLRRRGRLRWPSTGSAVWPGSTPAPRRDPPRDARRPRTRRPRPVGVGVRAAGLAPACPAGGAGLRRPGRGLAAGRLPAGVPRAPACCCRHPPVLAWLAARHVRAQLEAGTAALAQARAELAALGRGRADRGGRAGGPAQRGHAAAGGGPGLRAARRGAAGQPLGAPALTDCPTARGAARRPGPRSWGAGGGRGPVGSPNPRAGAGAGVAAGDRGAERPGQAGLWGDVGGRAGAGAPPPGPRIVWRRPDGPGSGPQTPDRRERVVSRTGTTRPAPATKRSPSPRRRRPRGARGDRRPGARAAPGDLPGRPAEAGPRTSWTPSPRRSASTSSAPSPHGWAPGAEPGRGRADAGAAPGVRLPARPDRLRHRPPGLRAQAAHRPAGLLDAAPPGRAVRLPEPGRVRARHRGELPRLHGPVVGRRHRPRLPGAGRHRTGTRSRWSATARSPAACRGRR